MRVLAVIAIMAHALLAWGDMILSGISMTGGMINSQRATYTESTSNFPNPERGWFCYVKPGTAEDDNETYPLLATPLTNCRSSYNSTLVHRFWVLDDYYNLDLDSTILTAIAADFTACRNNGYKVILRFTYNSDTDYETYHEGDTTLAWVETHLSQLASTLSAGSDVIYALELGFVGKWGEWHNSTNSLIGGPLNDRLYSLNQNSQDIIDAIISALPSDKMALIRVPYYKLLYLYDTAITESIAFNETEQTRIGYHNDGWIWDVTDANTFDDDSDNRAAEQSYLASETSYVPYIVTPGTNNAYAQAANAIALVGQYHISAIGANHYQATDLYAHWVSENEWDDIEMALGYRYVLTETIAPISLSTSDTLWFAITMKNAGSAGIYNDRNFQIVLRNQSTQNEYTADYSGSEDIRLWLPEPGETKTLYFSESMPGTIIAGTYDVFLNLNDVGENIDDDPDYSIQLANDNVWESETGYNDLGVDLAVTN